MLHFSKHGALLAPLLLSCLFLPACAPRVLPRYDWPTAGANRQPMEQVTWTLLQELQQLHPREHSQIFSLLCRWSLFLRGDWTLFSVICEDLGQEIFEQEPRERERERERDSKSLWFVVSSSSAWQGEWNVPSPLMHLFTGRALSTRRMDQVFTMAPENLLHSEEDRRRLQEEDRRRPQEDRRGPQEEDRRGPQEEDRRKRAEEEERTRLIGVEATQGQTSLADGQATDLLLCAESPEHGSTIKYRRYGYADLIRKLYGKYMGGGALILNALLHVQYYSWNVLLHITWHVADTICKVIFEAKIIW